MENFSFNLPTRLIFGKGAQDSVGGQLTGYKKVLLHYGGGSIKKNGLYERAAASLKAAGVDFIELGGVVPQPDIRLVREGAALCKKEGVDFILAVGGGSVIDSAKAIALGYYYDGDVWEIYANGIRPKKALPVGVILTIPAAGSESSDTSVITDYEQKLKKGVGSDLLRPVFCIINPELFFTLPKEQLGYGVADIMSHILERYFTTTAHTDLIDDMAEAAMRTVLRNALLSAKNPQDYDAWAQIGLCGTFAQNNLLGIGRKQHWACHPLCNRLSAQYGVAHGEGLAILMPAWMEYVYKKNLDLFTQFAVNVMGVKGGSRVPEEIAYEGIERLRDVYRRIGAPLSLKQTGVDLEHLEDIAKAVTNFTDGNEKPIAADGYYPLYWQDVLSIYRLAV